MPDQPDFSALIAQLEAERAELDVTIAHLRRRLGLPANTEGATPPVVAPVSREVVTGRDVSVVIGRVRTDEFFRMSISDAIVKYLTIMKQPQNPGSIVNGLKSGGVLTNAKHFYANVNTELKRMRSRNLVVNTPSGWGLAEWYPQKPKQAAPNKGKGKKSKKRKRQQENKAKQAKQAPPVPSKNADQVEPQNWHQFLGAAARAGKTMEQAALEWQQRKVSNS